MTDESQTKIPRAHELSSPSARRWLPLLALAALLLFAGVAGALAWRQYRDSQRTDLKDARAKAAVAATVFDVIFAGEIGTLQSISQAPVVVTTDQREMLTYFKRVMARNGKLFTGGLGWIDRQGRVRVTTNGRSTGPAADVSDRAYFRAAVRTRQPYVSAGLTGRRNHQHVVVIAVPTANAAGELTGVLAGSLLVTPTRTSARTIDLGYSGLAVLDREKQLVFSDFAHPRSLEALERFGKATEGVLSDTHGLDGDPGHVVAYARSKVPQWSVISIGRAPRSSAASGAASSWSSP